MRYLGHEGYTKIAGEIVATSRRLKDGLEAIEGVDLVGRPDLPVIAWRTPGLPVEDVVAGMTSRGWFVRTMARPSAIHMGMITMQQAPVVEEYLEGVRDSVAEVQSAQGAVGSRNGRGRV
jgi:glutamate/tyrosine decarboxylase-like PLP-dependent enzyme